MTVNCSAAGEGGREKERKREGDCDAQQLATWKSAPPRQVAVYKYPSPHPVYERTPIPRRILTGRMHIRVS